MPRRMVKFGVLVLPAVTFMAVATMFTLAVETATHSWVVVQFEFSRRTLRAFRSSGT